MGMLERLRRALFGTRQAQRPAGSSAAGHGDPAQPVDQGSAHVHAEEELMEDVYTEAVREQRQEKDHFFLHAGGSPIPPDHLERFEGLAYFSPDLAYQFILPLERGEQETLVMETSTGEQQRYERAGTVAFEVEGQSATLALYRSEQGDLFLPFRDATSGKESYGAGRYLEPVELESGEVLVDFNLAYNPFCAYSPDYSCPLPPFENWLKIPIRAGEKNYPLAEEHQDGE